MFLEAPFAGKHPKLFEKGTKAAAAEVAELFRRRSDVNF
jgi:hypothetical protein